MIVFNLSCSHSHTFEGWFTSADDFASQQDKGLLSCPVCGDQSITKRLSAPRLNLSSAVAGAPAVEPAAHPTIEQMQSLWYQTAAKLLRETDNVGERFAEEARKIHYKEAPQRAIRGQVDAQEREALADEGISVYSMPIPNHLKESLQ